MVWDGRAKALICCYNDCHLAIVRKKAWDVPTQEEITFVLDKFREIFAEGPDENYDHRSYDRRSIGQDQYEYCY